MKLLACKNLLSGDGMYNSCDAPVPSIVLLCDVVETSVWFLKIQIQYKLFDMKQQVFKLFIELMHYNVRVCCVFWQCFYRATSPLVTNYLPPGPFRDTNSPLLAAPTGGSLLFSNNRQQVAKSEQRVNIALWAITGAHSLNGSWLGRV